MMLTTARCASLALGGLLAVIVAGCSSPAAAPSPTPSAAAASPSATPTPTPAIKAGFSVPDQCVDLVSSGIEPSLAARGPVIEQPYYGEVPIGDPFEVGDPTGEGLDVGTVSDYLLCDWGASGSLVEVLVAAVDSETYTPWVNEIMFWGYGTATTSDGLTWSNDGDVTDSAGRVTSNIGFADYWILRENSMITVQVQPGGPAALQEAMTIAADIAATTGAD